jgi:DNA adenine methylase
MMKNIEVKPALKWAGGKRRLIPDIRKYYKEIRPKKYIEPFFGGGSVYFDIIKTFGIDYKNRSIINDVNTDLIEMYRNIKSFPQEIIFNCKELEKDYYKYNYYYIRDRFNGIDREKNAVERYEGIIRSSALILLNRTCFNGLYRINGKGLFNVPKGSYKNPRIVDEENLYKLSSLLPNIENIRNTEFDKIEEVEGGDLVYFDPPYHPLNETSSFTSYSGLFGRKEQIRLRDYYKELNEKGVYVILSNSSSPFIKEIYDEFNIVEVYCSRSISSKSNKRGRIPEFLVVGDKL